MMTVGREKSEKRRIEKNSMNEDKWMKKKMMGKWWKQVKLGNKKEQKKSQMNEE